ncbi:hypothetical protein SLH49_03070 [Cognatiyoonia sp. IB215446]|nr:hypothetical protein [Cognatiyoonia sp. IB215446]MDX8346958.1 hypothetical protein [Cognatiyoonia sp. IB215446]
MLGKWRRCDIANKAEAMPVNCTHETLCSAVIINRLPRGLNRGGDGTVRNEAAVPNTVYQFIFRDDAVTIFNEQNEDIKHFWFDWMAPACALQLSCREVNFKVIETVNHAKATVLWMNRKSANTLSQRKTGPELPIRQTSPQKTHVVHKRAGPCVGIALPSTNKDIEGDNHDNSTRNHARL